MHVPENEVFTRLLCSVPNFHRIHIYSGVCYIVLRRFYFIKTLACAHKVCAPSELYLSNCPIVG
jgi:hypothetical protein